MNGLAEFKQEEWEHMWKRRHDAIKTLDYINPK